MERLVGVNVLFTWAKGPVPHYTDIQSQCPKYIRVVIEQEG